MSPASSSCSPARGRSPIGGSVSSCSCFSGSAAEPERTGGRAGCAAAAAAPGWAGSGVVAGGGDAAPARRGVGLGAGVLGPGGVDDPGRGRGLRPAAAALAAAGRLAARRGVLPADALLEGLVTDIAETVVVTLGLGRLLPAAASARP